MASKLLFKQLRSLTNTTRHRFATSTSTSDFQSKLRPLIHQRLYADTAAAAAPTAAPAAPTPPVDLGKPLPNSKKVVKKLGSVNEAEVAKFTAMAEQWWELEGIHKQLHAINPIRLAFLRSSLCRHFGKDPTSARPLEGLKIADVGCGGGILTEPLARLGAYVTGVDAGEENIKIARLHAASDPATSSIEYLCTTAEKLVEEQRQFDAVVSLEVIEHVANPEEFCKSLSELTVPGGALAFSTINRTMRSYGFMILGVEYVMQWLPKGTHDWTMFVTPEELAMVLQRHQVTIQEIAGLTYDPLTGQFRLTDDIETNYIAFATKSVEGSNEAPAS